MRIEQKSKNFFILHGKIKELSDYQDLKALLEKFRKKAQMGEENALEVHFEIPQAREINQYILGYWLKLARKDNFKLHLYVASPYLYNNLLKFGLHLFFEVKNDRME